MNSIIGNKKARSVVEQTAEIIFTICAFFAVLAVISITVYMFLNGIRQEVLLAEMRGVQAALAFRMAQCRLIDKIRHEARFYSRFISYDGPRIDLLSDENGEFISGCDEKMVLAAEDPMMVAFLEKQEWQALTASLPYPARKLVEFARFEAERFEDVPEGIWTRTNITELRRRVKRDWIAWDRNHSERAYIRTKNVLVAVLRRSRHRGGGG